MLSSYLRLLRTDLVTPSNDVRSLFRKITVGFFDNSIVGVSSDFMG